MMSGRKGMAEKGCGDAALPDRPREWRKNSCSPACINLYIADRLRRVTKKVFGAVCMIPKTG
jgi:hypothetical protein